MQHPSNKPAVDSAAAPAARQAVAAQRLKPLAWALLGAGLAAMGTAGANTDWFDMPWLQRVRPAAASGSTAAPAAAGTPSAQSTPAAPRDTGAQSALAAPAVAATNASPSPTGTPGAGPSLVTAPNYRAIVLQSGPAVVGVTVEGVKKTGGAEADPMQRYFRGFPGFPGGQGGAQQQPFKGQGSGFIVSADGLILTNAHVVQDAKEVTVRLADRREFAAKVLGSDPATDIAVLRIQARDLPTVHLGDPRGLMVGDPVLAIGAPYGLEQTATAGIVSAKGRSLPGDAFVPFIQTDAAVNPGNSGGPLFDAGGQVVGINAQIYSRTGGFQGVSFAIPIDVALKVRDQIVATGRAQHARLGVSVQDLTTPLAESFGLQRPDGALVAQVDAQSPAAQAGLKSGDVILQVDGETIAQAGQLSSRIGLSRPGDTVRLTVWRDHAQRSISVTLGQAQASLAQADDSAEGAADGMPRLGLALRPLSPQERSRAQLDHGMLVQQADGAAAQAGLNAGDVVMAINGRPVDAIDDLRAVLKKKPKSVALLVWRGGERLFVPVPLA